MRTCSAASMPPPRDSAASTSGFFSSRKVSRLFAVMVSIVSRSEPSSLAARFDAAVGSLTTSRNARDVSPRSYAAACSSVRPRTPFAPATSVLAARSVIGCVSDCASRAAPLPASASIASGGNESPGSDVIPRVARLQSEPPASPSPPSAPPSTAPMPIDASTSSAFARPPSFSHCDSSAAPTPPSAPSAAISPRRPARPVSALASADAPPPVSSAPATLPATPPANAAPGLSIARWRASRL